MAGLTTEGGMLTARFSFPPEFIGFQGHFPGKSILPGVCQIQSLLCMLEQGSGKAVVLKEIELAKYFSPVSPREEVVCNVREFGDATGERTVKAVITKETVKVAEMKLRVSFIEKGGK